MITKIAPKQPTLRVGIMILFFTLSAGAILFLLNPTPLQLVRNAAFDQFQRIKPRSYRTSPVRIIDLDDESLKRLGQWPWPRTRLAELVSKLQTTEPAVIAFDIIFAEPDRTSPQSMFKVWQLSPENQRLLSHLPDHDQALLGAIDQGKVVLGFTLTNELNSNARPPIAKARFVEIGGSPQPFLTHYKQAVTSLPMFEQAAQGNGALTFVPDADGIVRKIPLLLGFRNTLLPSLAIEALRIRQQATNYTIRSLPEQGAGISEIRIGQIAVPTTPNGEIWIHYTKPEKARSIPAWQILSGNVRATDLTGGIFLIGTSAQGLMDLRFSPLGGVIPGVEIHAQVLEQMLTGSHLLRPSWSSVLELLTITVGGLAIGIIALHNGVLVSFAVFTLSLACLWLGAWQAYIGHGLLLDPMVPTIILTLVFLGPSLYRHFYSERRQLWVKRAFARYISPNLVNHLIAHPEELVLGGRRQVCSFVFSDLTDFTGLMEKMNPADVVTVLNDYLDKMIAIAFAHHGTLDRIVGDAVAIMFSAPVAQQDHQRRAIACALEMYRFTRQYSSELNAKGIHFGRTRFGVHSGEVIVGNFGGGAIFDYRALGDPVNTASRLESANKHLGTNVCISEATLSTCPDIAARPIGRLLVKGKSRSLQVFEPLEAARIDETALSEYLAAYQLLCNSHPDAVNAFGNLCAKYPGDGLAAFHFKRLTQNKSGDLIELNEK